MPKPTKKERDPEELLAQAFRITGRELDGYEKRKALTPAEAQAVQGYTRVLLSATKKQQEADDEELENLTDEEIAAKEAEIMARAKGKP